jgi:allantoicase
MNDFTTLPDLAAERLGGAVESATDEFFAPKEGLLKEAAPVWKEGEYTDRGKWMDGWETRRHRAPDHDWCEIRLGLPGVVRGVVIDTAFFRGNFPEAASLEGLAGDTWVDLLPRVTLSGNHVHTFPVDVPQKVTRLRFHIHPDGGVARLRVHGEVRPDLGLLGRRGELDVAGLDAGGSVTTVSDAFFSAPWHLLLPDRPHGMHDGWETRRRRGPGHDHAEVALCAESWVHRIEVDTSYFRGNFPTSCSIDGKVAGAWRELVPMAPLSAHRSHVFPVEVDGVTDVRLNIHPDGGVARLRVHGSPTRRGWSTLAGRELWASPWPLATLGACCGSTRWAREMGDARPADLFAACDAVMARLSREDLLEAFAAHPPIGATRLGTWSTQEQAGLADADDRMLARIAEQNAAYQARFGHVYLVCATGRGPAELLAILDRRLAHDPATELRVAAEELRRITRIRLAKATGMVDPASWADGGTSLLETS